MSILRPNAAEESEIVAEKLAEDNPDNYSLAAQENVELAKGMIIRGPWLDIRMFGVVGDGVVDDSNALELAAEFARINEKTIYCPPGCKIRVTRPISLKGINVQFEGRIIADFNGTGVTIGGYKVKQYFREAWSHPGGVWLNTDHITLRVVGAVESNIQILECAYLQILADGDISDGEFTAYSTFNLEVIRTFEITSNPTPKDPKIIQWVNENRFKGGAFRRFIIADHMLYPPDNNVFEHPSFEDATIHIGSGNSNMFRDCRFEGNNSLNLSEKCRFNIFEQLYCDGTLSGCQNTIYGVTVSDHGYGNIITKTQWNYFENIVLFSLSGRNKVFNSTDGIQGGIHKLRIQQKWKKLYSSPYIPVPETDCLCIQLNSDCKGWAISIFIMDKDLKPITTEPAGKSYILSHDETFYFTSTIGVYRTGASEKSLPVIIRNPDSKLKYIRVDLSTGEEDAVGAAFESVALSLQCPKNMANIYCKASYKEATPCVETGITSGLGKTGEIVYKSTGGYYQCSFRLDTYLTYNAAAGTRQIRAAVTTGVQVNDIIGVLLDNLETHWGIVAAVSKTIITLRLPLPATASAGKCVVINRWV